MCRAFSTYIEQLEAADAQQQLGDALTTVADSFDLPLVAYIGLSRRRHLPLRLITNYPPIWATHYFANNYQYGDPVLSRSRIETNPFDWNSDFANDNDFARRFFCEAAEYGIRFGRTIPIHNRRGPVAAVTFATDRCYPTFSSSIRRNADTLELIALYFHAHVSRTLGIVRNVYLTDRERQCLYWASLGKSARDIGEILNLSERTVKFHLHNVRSKFDVATTIQAAVAYERAKVRENSSP